MVVNKDKSFDTRFKGDFSLKKNKLTKEVNNDFIYTCLLYTSPSPRDPE